MSRVIERGQQWQRGESKYESHRCFTCSRQQQQQQQQPEASGRPRRVKQAGRLTVRLSARIMLIMGLDEPLDRSPAYSPGPGSLGGYPAQLFVSGRVRPAEAY